jgi:hypothetical protein
MNQCAGDVVVNAGINDGLVSTRKTLRVVR